MDFRLAARDLTRQAHRTIPATMAIAAIVFAFGIGITGVTSPREPLVSGAQEVRVQAEMPVSDAEVHQGAVRDAAEVLGNPLTIEHYHLPREVEDPLTDEVYVLVSEPNEMDLVRANIGAEAEQLDQARKDLAARRVVVMGNRPDELGDEFCVEHVCLPVSTASIPVGEYQADTVIVPLQVMEENNIELMYAETVLLPDSLNLWQHEQLRTVAKEHNGVWVVTPQTWLGTTVIPHLFNLVFMALAAMIIIGLVTVLSVSETRRDLATLWMLGSPSGVLRKNSVWQGLLMALIATVTALVAIIVNNVISHWILVGNDVSLLSTNSWTAWLLLLIGIPLIGAVTAWLASLVVSRSTWRESVRALKRR